jgi:hypothetical protein
MLVFHGARKVGRFERVVPRRQGFPLHARVLVPQGQRE